MRPWLSDLLGPPNAPFAFLAVPLFECFCILAFSEDLQELELKPFCRMVQVSNIGIPILKAGQSCLQYTLVVGLRVSKHRPVHALARARRCRWQFEGCPQTAEASTHVQVSAKH